MSSVIQNGEQQVYASMVDQLAAAPDTFRRLMGERSADDLRLPGQDGGVAVVEIMAHMQDWEEITGERIVQIVRENAPVLERFDDSLWSIEHGYAERDAWEVLEAFTTSRAAIVEILTDIDPSAWQRSAELEGHGTITLGWLIERVTRHDAKHAQQIQDALS